MARIISLFTTVFLALQSLFGIGGITFGKVTLVLEANSYIAGTETIRGTLHNGTRKPIAVAPYAYSLEYLEDGEWAHVAWKDDIEIPSAMFLLQPFESAGKSFRLKDYDSLPAGRYRLTASGSAYAEFTLVDAGEVTLTPEFDTYPVGTKQITATLYNGTPETFDYTAGYGVQKWDGGAWAWVNLGLAFPAVMYDLGPLQSRTFPCELSYCEPTLEAGRYRIAVRDAYAEFTLV